MRKGKALLIEVSEALAAGAVFLILIFLLHLPFLFAAVIGVLLYIAVSLIARPSRFRIGKIEVDDADTFQELKETIGEGYSRMEAIEKLSVKISNSSVREKVTRISAITKKVFAYLEKNPNKIRSAKRFFSYYLETTYTILSKYVELSEQDLDTPEIVGTLRKVEEILDSIAETFEKQLSALMENEVIDLDAEISLLKNTMKMGGF
ncbi:hypothetical protein E4665_11830 [Sporolactobacillus shoreae]|uniref:5-bromo-4-chloroindolyl phosphate hydrolysis protein n=1 Tax=Sporolactobacillus shoreae TaxID=1465501 RepID=A0A4Z0GNS1_9BACL|nr:5-bromo-4-chloroindolyl phosphate hydrolysis family protein [Sporolactobacillus shoreae]TGA97528.1 hypothetical protein E4665_11830 [Sporolactobacillus shoreae]